ncbi:MAG: transcription termination factor NusA [Phycisphaerales bacterium]
MNQETLRIIDSIARDRNIDKEALFRDIEAAMVSAARKHFGSLDTEEFRCEMDRLSGEIRLWRIEPPEAYDEETGEPIGGGAEEEIPLAQLGRIPAQTAKQVMIQRFREDERASLYEEFSKRMGELATGIAQRYEGGALIVQIDRAEGFMPRSEQIPGEQFQPGDRVRCLILDVRDLGNQVKIVLSRGNPDFIRRLFEVEVPEVAERIIEIKAMAREPGFRTKLAVSSIDSKVDAVGACVGVRGSRIRNIVDELAGEKIDIVRWNESSQILIQNALKPAEVTDVSLCFELGRATVVVEEDQLSLAIGKRGQNVRLAARLTGWDIDILTPEEYSRGIEILVETMKGVEGVTEETLDKLGALGMISVFDVEEVGPEVLIEELEIDADTAERMVEIAAVKAKTVAEEQQREKEEEEQRRAQEAKLAESLLGGAGGDEGSSDASSASSPEAEAAAAAILGGGEAPAPSGGDETATASTEPKDADDDEESSEEDTPTVAADSEPDEETEDESEAEVRIAPTTTGEAASAASGDESTSTGAS